MTQTSDGIDTHSKREKRWLNKTTKRTAWEWARGICVAKPFCEDAINRVGPEMRRIGG